MDSQEKSLIPDYDNLRVFYNEGFKKVGLIQGVDILNLKMKTESLLIILCGSGVGGVLLNGTGYSMSPGDILISTEQNRTLEISLKGEETEICFFECTEDNSRIAPLRRVEGVFSSQGDPLRIPLMMSHLLFDSSCRDLIRSKMVEEGSRIVLGLLDMKLREQYPLSFYNKHSKL